MSKLSPGIRPKRAGGHPFRWEPSGMTGTGADEPAWISMISCIAGSGGFQTSEMMLESEAETDVMVRKDEVRS